MSFTTTFKKYKCIKCLSDKFVLKSKHHAQNQNAKYFQVFHETIRSQTVNILQLFPALITALKRVKID